MRNDPARRRRDTYPWFVTLDTRFDDMDVNFHLNNVSIARLYEEARVRFNYALRAQHPELRPRYVVGHIALDYLGEGHYPAPVTIGYGVASFGTTSYRAALGMFQGDACIGLSDAVMVHRVDNAVAPIPAALRAALGEWTLRP